MTRDEASAYAVVTLTIEIPVGGSWGPDCTVGQVHKQALDSATGSLRQAMQSDRATNGPCFPRGTRVVGTPKVTKVITSRGDP